MCTMNINSNWKDHFKQAPFAQEDNQSWGGFLWSGLDQDQ